MPKTQRKHLKSETDWRPYVPVGILVVLICVLVVLVFQNAAERRVETGGKTATGLSENTETEKNTKSKAEASAEASDPTLAEFLPAASSNTKPGFYVKDTAVMVDGEQTSDYTPDQFINFDKGEAYTNVQGIVTFRGNNFRDGGSYGTADIVKKKFSDAHWTVQEGSLQAPDGNIWTGSGWVGQPLMMTWPKAARAHMNMYDWAKNADTLTEVVYATMDGNVYFIDLATGKKTRDDLNLGYTFKGSGALDPRGYPILYLGSGYNSAKGTSHAFIINLFDCKVMYEFGANDPFSLRSSISFFDGSALVDAETDQLIYPGESGILYIMKLNTKYNETAGTLSVSPSKIVKWRYNGVRTTKDSFWLGMEDSAVIWRGHIIMSDNGGNLMCLDLNTLKLDWVQNILDDTNCSPVLELENGHPYVYISTSFHAGWRAPADSIAKVPVWKIDAVNGEIVWQHDFSCYTEDGVSGGVQATATLGKMGLKDLVFFSVARTPDPTTGLLVAFNKTSGKLVWQRQTQVYSWSSPVAVYDKSGNGYLVFCTSGGYMYLIDGLTGAVLDSLDVKGHVEATPAIYNGTVVVGTRSQQIWGVKIT